MVEAPEVVYGVVVASMERHDRNITASRIALDRHRQGVATFGAGDRGVVVRPGHGSKCCETSRQGRITGESPDKTTALGFSGRVNTICVDGKLTLDFIQEVTGKARVACSRTWCPLPRGFTGRVFELFSKLIHEPILQV